MINTSYSIGNDLSYVKPGDLAFHTERGYINVHHIKDDGSIVDDLAGVWDKTGRDPHAVGYPNVMPVLFESIVAAIGYFTYYQHFMTNDRNLDPKMK